MTRNDAKELLPIIQAFAEGKTIQVRDEREIWGDVGDGLNWNLRPSRYRVKPREVVLCEFNGNLQTCEDGYFTFDKSSQAAHIKPVTFVEKVQ